jgi:hypothetical protein
VSALTPDEWRMLAAHTESRSSEELAAAFREARRLTKSALDGEGCTDDWWQGTEAMAVWLEHALAEPQR